MLQTLDRMLLADAKPVTVPDRTWSAIPRVLEQKGAAGASKASLAKSRSAVSGLLTVAGVTAENAPLDLDWFDRTFPVDGWDPATMPFTQGTYRDYRNRVRPLLAEMLGTAAQTQTLRAAIDDWDAAAADLEGLAFVAGPHSKKRMIPFRSTLTMAARRAGLTPRDLDQAALVRLHAAAKKSERPSLRAASRMIAEARTASPEIARRFPHPIRPIEADGAFRYAVPERFSAEVEAFVERGARRRFIRAKNVHDYVSEGTRTGMTTSLRAAVHALIATGHLDARADSFAPSLRDPEALGDMLGHIVDRIGETGITARHATTLVSRLPTILERNGIDSAPLRALIGDVEELGQHAGKTGMPERTKRLCRALIEKRKLRNTFLLAHAKPRLIAQTILDVAAAEDRHLTREERRTVIMHGVVALFCAIEIGGAPVRVENVLAMPYGGETAWMRVVGQNLHVLVPGAFVKNRKDLRFEMQPGPHRFCETVHWYLDNIRPLILADPASGETRASPWLVPMLSDPRRSCPYETFHGWFVRIMRDVVGVPCTPHNFRHGQASLLYHRYPERIGWIAIRLGDTEDTVLRHYAWVHAEKAMAEGQRLISQLIEG